MGTRANYVPFYPTKWLGGVSGMTPAEVGIYINLLMLMYDAGGPIALDNKRLARRMCCAIGTFNSILNSLIDDGKITLVDGYLTNERAEIELEKLNQKRLSASESAKSRWKETPNKTTGVGMRTHSERNAIEREIEKEDISDTKPPLTEKPDTVIPDVEDVWKHVTPEGRKRSSKDEVATAYSKAIKKLNHGEIIAGVRAYYEDCTKTGCGHMAPHRLLWDSRAKKPGRVINYVPKQKTDKVSLDDLRAWVRMRELSHVFVWPESKAGMDEQTARQLLEAS